MTVVADPTLPGVFDLIADKPGPYADEGDFSYSITVTDNADNVSTSGNGAATVADAAIAAGGPSLLQIPVGHSFSGVIGTLHDDNPDATAADFTITVDWGDSSGLDNNQTGTITLTPLGNGDFQINGTHNYPALYTRSSLTSPMTAARRPIPQSRLPWTKAWSRFSLPARSTRASWARS